MSLIWKYFKDDPTNAKYAICLMCEKPCSRGSDDPKKQTTHGMRKHLELWHHDEHNLFQNVKRKNNVKEKGEDGKKKKKKKRKKLGKNILNFSLFLFQRFFSKSINIFSPS